MVIQLDPARLRQSFADEFRAVVRPRREYCRSKLRIMFLRSTKNIGVMLVWVLDTIPPYVVFVHPGSGGQAVVTDS